MVLLEINSRYALENRVFSHSLFEFKLGFSTLEQKLGFQEKAEFSIRDGFTFTDSPYKNMDIQDHQD